MRIRACQRSRSIRKRWCQHHLPWVLDATPSQVASLRGVDRLNNVEQVAIDSPANGVFTAKVNGLAVTGEQPFCLVYSC